MKLLDLFCGAGGAAMGYHRAGFEVVGVDINPQPRYPFPFQQADAMKVLECDLSGFDVIHASPPCQAYSVISATNGTEYPDLVAPTRQLLLAGGVPYVMENVEGAPLHSDANLFGEYGITLCGSMFDLEVERGQLRRHRVFESSVMLPQPECRHRGFAAGVYGNGGYTERHRKVRGEEAHRLMGIDWMDHRELTQSIPPAYTSYVGYHLMRALGVESSPIPRHQETLL